MTLVDLSDPERLALAGLIRLVVTADQNYSPGEAEELARLADEIGADAFWEVMERAGSHFESSEQIRAAAADVQRAEARELIYGALLGIAQHGAVSGGELELLGWLAERWQIDEETEPEPDVDADEA